MLWENWRLTRGEAAWRLSFGLVGGSAALALSDSGATIAVWVLLSQHGIFWMSIAKLTGGRFMDGYRPGFPLHLLYTRPVRTSVIVGVAMGYDAVSGAAMYVASAALLGFAFGQTLPVLSMAVLIVVFHMVCTFVQWSTRSRVVQWLGSFGIWGPVVALFNDSCGRVTTAARLLVRRHRTDGLDWPRVVRAHGRRGGAAASRRRAGGHPPDGGMRRIPGLARRPVPVPVSHLVCDAGAGVVRPEVQRTAGAGDRTGPRDRDSAVVRGHHPARCRALRGLHANRSPEGSRWSWRCSPCRPC